MVNQGGPVSSEPRLLLSYARKTINGGNRTSDFFILISNFPMLTTLITFFFSFEILKFPMMPYLKL